MTTNKDELEHYICILSNSKNLYEVVVSSETDGIFHFPYYRYSKDILEFVSFLYRNDLLIEFDWTEFNIGEILKDYESVDKLEVLELKKILYTILRKDRFCEGTLVGFIDDGLIVKILKRLHILLFP